MDLLVRIVITIGVVWLTQVLLGAFEVKEPANKIIFVVVLLLAILWLVTGSFLVIK